MIDFTPIVAIIIIIIAVYLIIKFIVNPIIKIISGIIIFTIFIYILHKFFGFNINNILGPFGISIPGEWTEKLEFLLNPINHGIDQIKKIINFIFGNLPKK